MADQTWKDKHIEEIKKQHRIMVQQIELDKKLYAQNIQSLKDITEVLEKLGVKLA
jgi:hypothetical protein